MNLLGAPQQAEIRPILPCPSQSNGEPPIFPALALYLMVEVLRPPSSSHKPTAVLPKNGCTGYSIESQYRICSHKKDTLHKDEGVPVSVGSRAAIAASGRTRLV
ncbi:MAG: hypothetical protein R6V56_01035 [Lentisphaeria bacterium]